MIARNRRTGESPIVLHAAGRNARRGWWQVIVTDTLNALAERTFAPDPGLSYAVVTWSTVEAPTTLERCCKLVGVEPVVIGRDHADGWRNIWKGRLALPVIERLDVAYVIGLDAFDVVLLEHPDEIVRRFRDRFEPEGTRMLFNAGNFPYPDRARAAFMAAAQDFEEGWRERDRYLNAGAWIGRRETVVAVLKAVQAVDVEMVFPRRYRHREQHVVRWTVFPRWHPAVDLDRRNAIFQHMEGHGDLAMEN